MPVPSLSFCLCGWTICPQLKQRLLLYCILDLPAYHFSNFCTIISPAVVSLSPASPSSPCCWVSKMHAIIFSFLEKENKQKTKHLIHLTSSSRFYFTPLPHFVEKFFKRHVYTHSQSLKTQLIRFHLPHSIRILHSSYPGLCTDPQIRQAFFCLGAFAYAVLLLHMLFPELHVHGFCHCFHQASLMPLSHTHLDKA